LHPRLVEIARIEDDFEFVLFTEDDCLLSPALDAAAVRRRAADLDALTPPIFFCAREARDWTWAQHATGDPAYDAATRDWSRATLLRCWAAYGGQPLPDDHRLPMFFGFSDCLIFRFSFLRRLAADLARLLPVWHEAAIPSAVLYRAERLGKLQGLALWGSERERPLAELVALLGRDDYVHPIKLSRFAPDEFLAAYRALTGG
jgi:hypothetical protein